MQKAVHDKEMTLPSSVAEFLMPILLNTNVPVKSAPRFLGVADKVRDRKPLIKVEVELFLELLNNATFQGRHAAEVGRVQAALNVMRKVSDEPIDTDDVGSLEQTIGLEGFKP